MERNEVAVTPDCRFPAECLLCGEKDVRQVSVTFTKVMILLVIGGLESVTLSVSLCQKHADDYQSKVFKYNLVMTVLFLMACASWGIMSQFTQPRKEPPIVIVLGVLGVVLIVAAFVVMLSKFRSFPVKLRTRQGPLFSGHSAYIFSFPDSHSAERFVRANAIELIEDVNRGK